MEPSQQYLRKIVERSSTIAERLDANSFSDEVQTENNLINSRFEKWCQVVSHGNYKQFQKRLSWDGLDITTVRRLLGGVRLSDNQPLPPWAETLNEALQVAALFSLETDNIANDLGLDIQEPIPFEEVFLPFIHVARKKLLDQVGSRYQMLSKVAHKSLERSLLLRLAELCSQSLELEFSIFRAFNQSSLNRILSQLQGNLLRQQYKDFLKTIVRENFLSFFQEYSVLARLVATLTDFWIEATAEFMERLATDWKEIQMTFQSNTELGSVVAISPNISDPHNRGRSVIALTFASGLKLIYKPKDLSLEVAYFQLLTWFNQHNPPLPLKLLKVINRSTYGWVEYVENLPCQDEEEAKRYYQRTGMLLCILHVLEGTDCHNENLIANGEHPVMIDMETLMHHRVREIDGQAQGAEAQYLVNQQFDESVLRSGLLPRWEFGSDGRIAYDISGLGGVGQHETPFRVPKWKNINTDNMILEYESSFMQPEANVASLKGLILSPNDYVDEIVDGFRQMYRFLVVHREALLAPGSPLGVFGVQQVRFVFRSTKVYGLVLRKTLAPKFLRDGADRSIELDILSRAMLSSDTKPNFWPLLKVEIQALQQLDIPYFTACSDSDGLVIASNQTIENCFKEPSYNQLISQMQQLSDEDLARQIAIIRGALYSRVATTYSSAASDKNTVLNLNDVSLLTQEQFLQQAVAIAAELKQRAIHLTDGSITWIGFEYLPETQRFQLQPLGYNLFDGVCGVALFLAALEKITGGTGYRHLLFGSLQFLYKGLQNSKSNQIIAKKFGIGGAVGCSSFIYALVRISQLLNDSALLEVAKQVAFRLTKDCITADKKLDIVAGSAGAILGLLALYKATTDRGILDLAIACGHHLLNHRVKSSFGARAWATRDGKLLTGFSHGAAGIAYALLCLYENSKEQLFLEAAQEAINYERSVFSPQDGNWPDFRGEKTIFVTAWCNGASGIGLARLGSFSILNTNEIQQDIEIALKTTEEFGLQGVDTLCCGNFGRIDLLLVASHKLSRPELLKTARKQASWLINRAEQTGYFHIFTNLPRDVYNPGLFQGTSGIGYALLRLAYPDLLPSVLLWE
jgi:type 2 lantibiotic biosynthesis protein LanM